MTDRPEELALSAGSNGATVAALRWAPSRAAGSRKKALAIHGRLDNAASYLGIGPLFAAAGIDLVALDLPGHGKSSWKDDGMYSLTSQSASILLALDSLGDGWDSDVIMVWFSRNLRCFLGDFSVDFSVTFRGFWALVFDDNGRWLTPSAPPTPP